MGYQTFVVPKGLKVTSSLFSDHNVTIWDVYSEEQGRYLGHVSHRARINDWTWKPVYGETQMFTKLAPITQILSEIAQEIRGENNANGT